ncbi:GGDEF domain-containing protein [candidate division CSSED10-310 bacterium]|uniref:GGDEF domain-containing protein n=1 Tax=candidate division CSSED10-310 bacterium TaxID=2855610 RepID=A0ABV6Z4E6_UNCC1
MESNNYKEIKLQRLKYHDHTISRMGYLILILTAFSGDALNPEQFGVNLEFLVLAVFMFFFVIFINWIPTPLGLHQRRIFIKTIAYIFFITAAIWISGDNASPLIYLFYLVFIGALLTLSREWLYLEIALITVCLLFLGLILGNDVLHALKLFVYQLIPFWVLAYFAVEIFQQVEDAKNQVELLSLTDNLTGLCNMRSFMMTLEAEVERVRRFHHPFSLLMLDLDNLKYINDRFGHMKGSASIRAAASILRQLLRKTDTAARYGGDEFIILLPETDAEASLTTAERICAMIYHEPFIISGTNIRMSVSIGLASFPHDGQTADVLIAKADKALYKSKRTGKNKACAYSMEVENLTIQNMASPAD